MTWIATSPLNALQNAVYSRLTTGGNKISYSVYDEVPPGATFPYVTLGNPASVPFEARNVMGEIVRFPFNSFTRDAGGKWQANQMINAIIQSLTADVISITGYKITQIYKVNSRVYREEKNPTDYTGELTVAFWVVKT
ncbi:MAG: DUF3168 domain-containing protein [Candidatus Aminicenantes bacterium]|nr:DUF3168 domain-containing protein [Candidatus Aminicenantes bacterium]